MSDRDTLLLVTFDVTRYLSSIGYLYLGSSCLSSSVLGLTAPFLFFPRPFTPSSVSRRDGGVRRDVTEENGPASDTVPRDGGRPACLVSRRSSPGSFPRLSFTPLLITHSRLSLVSSPYPHTFSVSFRLTLALYVPYATLRKGSLCEPFASSHAPPLVPRVCRSSFTPSTRAGGET